MKFEVQTEFPIQQNQSTIAIHVTKQKFFIELSEIANEKFCEFSSNSSDFLFLSDIKKVQNQFKLSLIYFSKT